jgi:uncharacterized membrane protein
MSQYNSKKAMDFYPIAFLFKKYTVNMLNALGLMLSDFVNCSENPINLDPNLMGTYNKVWRLFFAVALIAIAVQQFICSGFRPVIMPPHPEWLFSSTFAMCVSSILLILLSFAIVFNINAHEVAVYLGTVFLIMLILFHIPNQIISNLRFLGGWSDAFKMLALSGGSFIVAASIPGTPADALGRFLEKLVPLGHYFFATTMIVFGIEHFMYTQFIETLVPAWLPGHMFWTYLAGAALFASGVAIAFNIRVKLAAGLLGLMIFLWIVVLHIPRAIADPTSGNGNEWTSVFEALAFSGVAFILSGQAAPATKPAPQAQVINNQHLTEEI